MDRFTEPVTKPYCCNKDWTFLHNCKFVFFFKQISFLASYAGYWDTLISWGKHLEGFQGHASEHTSISADVSYGKTRSDCSSFYSKEAVAQNLFTG